MKGSSASSKEGQNKDISNGESAKNLKDSEGPATLSPQRGAARKWPQNSFPDGGEGGGKITGPHHDTHPVFHARDRIQSPLVNRRFCFPSKKAQKISPILAERHTANQVVNVGFHPSSPKSQDARQGRLEVKKGSLPDPASPGQPGPAPSQVPTALSLVQSPTGHRDQSPQSFPSPVPPRARACHGLHPNVHWAPSVPNHGFPQFPPTPAWPHSRQGNPGSKGSPA